MGGRTGTDADELATAGRGIKMALLSIPLRSMHTVAETIDPEDAANTARLMALTAKEGFNMKYEQLWKDIETLCAGAPAAGKLPSGKYLIEQNKRPRRGEVDPLGNLLVRKKGKKKRCCSFPPIWTKWALLSPTLMKKGFLSFAPVAAYSRR